MSVAGPLAGDPVFAEFSGQNVVGLGRVDMDFDSLLLEAARCDFRRAQGRGNGAGHAFLVLLEAQRKR